MKAQPPRFNVLQTREFYAEHRQLTEKALAGAAHEFFQKYGYYPKAIFKKRTHYSGAAAS